MQNLLSNNEQVNTCSEPWILLNYANQIKPKLINGVYDNEFAIGAYYNYKKANPEFDDKEGLKAHLFSIYEPMSHSFDYVIDKTPRYWEIMDEIASLFPKAKIIILKRDPIAVVTSMLKTYKMTKLLELNRFRRDLLYAPKKLATFCKKHKNNPQVYTLRYEDLIANTPAQTEKLYQWIGIDFTEQVLNVAENTKFRGHFGDPFQNKDAQYRVAKKQASLYQINKKFNRFITGYANALGPKFLKEYGDYTLNVKARNTTEFKYFEFLGVANNQELDSLTIKNVLKKLYFKLMLG